MVGVQHVDKTGGCRRRRLARNPALTTTVAGTG
jgi:hypothetical protein